MAALNKRCVWFGILLVTVISSLSYAAVTAYWSYDEDIYLNASADPTISLYGQPADSNGSNVIDPNAKPGYGKALRSTPQLANLWAVEKTLEKILPAEEGTVEMWIAPSWSGVGKGGAGVGGAGKWQLLFSADTGTVFTPGFQIMIINNGWPNDGGQVMAYWNDGAGGYAYLNNSSNQPWLGGVDGTTYNWSAGEWHHIAFCWDTASLALFLDGNVVRRENRPSSASAHDKTWAFWLFGHGSNEDPCTPAINTWNGKVDELVIWDVAKYPYWESFTPPLPLSDPLNCQQVQNMGYGLREDINDDCRVDFKDFAILAQDWTACNVPGEPGCQENWW